MTTSLGVAHIPTNPLHHSGASRLERLSRRRITSILTNQQRNAPVAWKPMARFDWSYQDDTFAQIEPSAPLLCATTHYTDAPARRQANTEGIHNVGKTIKQS